MSYSYTFSALCAEDVCLARVESSFNLKDSAFFALFSRTYVLAHDIHALNDYLTFFGRYLEHFSFFALIVAGVDY